MPAFIWHIDGAAVIFDWEFVDLWEASGCCCYSDKFSQIASEGAGSPPAGGKWAYVVFGKSPGPGTSVETQDGWDVCIIFLVADLGSSGSDSAQGVFICLGL